MKQSTDPVLGDVRIRGSHFKYVSAVEVLVTGMKMDQVINILFKS